MRFPRRSLLVFILLFLSIQPVQAHGYIVRALPDDRVTLEHPPARLQYWFSENLEPKFSTLTLRDQSGEALAEGGVDPGNTSLMTLKVPDDLPDGAYLVDLRPAFASDGHVVAETHIFFVGEAAGDVAGSEADYSVVPLEVVWRALLYASTLLLFGVFVLYVEVLLPAWGNSDHRAGLLPPRVMRRLGRIVIGALVIAFLANVIAILQQSMVFFNTGLTEVIDQKLWQVVRIGSRFGDVWGLRMFLLALIAVFFGLSRFWREEHPDMVRAFWTANVWVAGLMLGAFSVTSHAAGSLMLPWVAMAVDWAHTLGVGAWVGGLVALVLVLPVALRPYTGDARRQALWIALRRFSRLAVVALAVVVTSGIYSALNWLYQPSDLTQTGWGLALVVKSGLVATLLVVRLAHHIAANPERYQRWAGRVRRTGVMTLRLEAFLAFLVLLSVAVLSASAVPEPVFLTASVSAPTATQTIGETTVQVTISPGGPGENTYDVVVQQDGQPDSDAQVDFQVVSPERDWRSAWQEGQPAGSGLYVVAGDDISNEGRWITLLNIRPPSGDSLRAAFGWDIRREAAIPDSIDPGPLNWLALAAVLLAWGWAAWPLTYRLYRWLDWRPASVVAGGGALLLTALALGASIALVNRSEEAYNAAISPPPQVINTVLPDASSLAAGRELYVDHCIDWQVHSSDFKALIDRLGRIRDEELFFAIRDGWRDLPPCSGPLTDEQRWHIVNFFRTLA